MSLRRSARNSTALAAKLNEISPSASSATKKRTDREDIPPRNQRKRVKKASPRHVAVEGSGTFKVPSVPTTPIRKRSAKTAQPPQLTPTPSIIGLIRTQYSSGDIDDATPPGGSTIGFFLNINLTALLVYTHSLDLKQGSRGCHASFKSLSSINVHVRPCPLVPSYVSRERADNCQMTVQLSRIPQTRPWSLQVAHA
jgi:hypothetical protein